MFSTPPLIALLIIDYLKPQEFVPALASLPFLYIFTALSIIGLILDVRLGLCELRGTPHIVWVVLFVLWSIITLGVNAPGQLQVRSILGILIPVSLYVLVAHSVQSFRMLQALVGVILAICLFLAAIGVHQGFAPWGCHQVIYAHGENKPVYDGRECEETDPMMCEKENAEPGFDYRCEHVGLFGTQSDHGRVRYRGALQDPNELALALGIAVPFAFAFVDRRRTLARQVLLVATLALVGFCAVLTQSRGGQLVFLAVLGVYFLNRFGKRGLVFGIILALPILLLGGREGAEDSTMERTECWFEGMLMFLHSPIFGVGQGQFLEHHFLTAHNSWVLSAAELGLPGMYLFSAILYLSTKIPVQILRRHQLGGPQPAPVALSWALAFLAAQTGLLVGITFLSYCYKEILWIYIGLSGALYQAMRRHDRTFEVSLTTRDLGLVFAIDALLLVVIGVYTRLKVG